jgi:hypothetical protein
MSKKLPVVPPTKKSPAQAQKEQQLAVAPVRAEAASVPEFPRKRDIRKAGALLGSAVLLATGGLASAKDSGKAAPNPGTIDGNPIPKKAPKIKLTREGGGIGPAQVMWEAEDVEAFLNWHFAHDGHMDIKTAYSMDLGDGMKVTLDGFDPNLNVGYEFVYGDADTEEFSDAAQAKLKDMMKAKKAAVLVINMTGTPDESTLAKKVTTFLAQVKKNPPAATATEAEPPIEHMEPKAC